MEKTILEIAEYLLGEGKGKNGAQIISNTTNIISKKKPDIVNSSESNLEIDEVISRVVQSFIHNNYKNKIKNLSSSKKYVDSFSEICYALNDNNISNNVKAKLIAIFLVWSFNAFFKKKSIA